MNKLPEGWSGYVGGIATNLDPKFGGIVDKRIVGGEFFAIPNNGFIPVKDGFKTQKEAIEYITKAAKEL